MGREYAAVAVAIVSTKSPEHFTKSAGGYFGGMVKRFEQDPANLCLGKTLWKLKQQTWGKEGIRERQAETAADERRRALRSRRTSHAFPAAQQHLPIPKDFEPSPELAAALAEAEQRLQAMSHPTSLMLPAPAPQPRPQLPAPASAAKSDKEPPAAMLALHNDYMRRRIEAQRPAEGDPSASPISPADDKAQR
jgi:hypothetical protein